MDTLETGIQVHRVLKVRQQKFTLSFALKLFLSLSVLDQGNHFPLTLFKCLECLIISISTLVAMVLQNQICRKKLGNNVDKVLPKLSVSMMTLQISSIQNIYHVDIRCNSFSLPPKKEVLWFPLF